MRKGEGLTMEERKGGGACPFAARPVVLFDFDGTVADTTGAVLTTARAALARCGYDPDSVGDLNYLIGPPLVDGFTGLLGVDRAEAMRLTDAYREIFNVSVTPADYPPNPGVPRLLAGLRERGTRIAIATSRLEVTALEMLSHMDLPPFETVAGRVEPGRDTKADCIAEALRRLGASPDDAVMVGDREHDTIGAHACGVPCIGVYTGTARSGEHERAGADVIAHGMPEVAALLGL